jgi:peptidoglycan/LPS O-acetylase OafA/YrhL
MKRFRAIEGLRGWLAWTVVFSHLVLTSGLYAKGLGPAAVLAGQYAVLAFVIISGFVITHLVVEREEPYGTYLLRRFMRLFPLFAVTCIIGFFTSDVYATTVSNVPWASNPSSSRYIALVTGVARSDHEFFWLHVLAHLSMLHGAINSSVLPFSQYAFNAPAWSISLEWQFYLIAPLVISLARRWETLLWLAMATAVLEFAYQFGLFGSFDLPAFLPGAAGYFGLGIASRIAYPKIIGTIRHPKSIFALSLVLLPLGWSVAPLLVWAIVFIGLVLSRDDAAKDTFTRVYHYAFESHISTYLGSRSYSVYLCHWPILAICHALWLGVFPTAFHVTTFLGVSIMVVPLTLLISEGFYRSIERPGILLGSRLARRNKTATLATKERVNIRGLDA